jgi:hypothetical protein
LHVPKEKSAKTIERDRRDHAVILDSYTELELHAVSIAANESKADSEVNLG